MKERQLIDIEGENGICFKISYKMFKTLFKYNLWHFEMSLFFNCKSDGIKIDAVILTWRIQSSVPLQQFSRYLQIRQSPWSLWWAQPVGQQTSCRSGRHLSTSQPSCHPERRYLLFSNWGGPNVWNVRIFMTV